MSSSEVQAFPEAPDPDDPTHGNIEPVEMPPPDLSKTEPTDE